MEPPASGRSLNQETCSLKAGLLGGSVVLVFGSDHDELSTKGKVR